MEIEASTRVRMSWAPCYSHRNALVLPKGFDLFDMVMKSCNDAAGVL